MLIELTPNQTKIEELVVRAEKLDLSFIPFTEQSYGCGFYKTSQRMLSAQTNDMLDIENCIYGVADNIKQIKEYHAGILNDPNKNYVVLLKDIMQKRSNAGKCDGWRWDKWGKYIGEFNPQCEYLDDEEFLFLMVICYSIYEVKKC